MGLFNLIRRSIKNDCENFDIACPFSNYHPVVLGMGQTLFETVKDKLAIKLTKSRAFGNGNVLLCYEPKG